MGIDRRVKGIVLVGWIVTIVVAFSAGHWSADSSTRKEDSHLDAGDSVSRERLEAAIGGSELSPDLDTTLATPELDDVGSRGYSALAQIADGASSDFLWNRAEGEAGLLSAVEARYWAEAYLDMTPGAARNEVLAELLGALAKTDPLSALNLAEQIGSLSATESARLSILEMWAQEDPQAALTWLESNRGSTPARLYRSRLESWMEGYAAADPASAFAYASSLPEGTNSEGWLKRRAMESVIEAHFTAGRWQEAMVSLQSLPEGVIKNEAMQDFYSEWAREDPLSAADHFLSNRSEEDGRAVAGLVREWASADPEEAARFVARLETSDPAYQVAVSSLIERWSRYDLDGPAEWLNQLPPSDEIDRAVAVFSVRAAEEDPASAMTWAASISGEQARSRVMQSVAASWKETDPAGLEQYIQENELDEATAAQLREAERSRGWRRWN